MKLRPVTKPDKRNKTMPKKIDDNNILESYEVIVKLMFSLLETCYLTKSENRTKKSLTQLSHYCFE